MGRLRFKSPNKKSKMKFAALIATAAASPTQFVVDNWWNEAQNVFNFAQTNWQQFASVADNVPDTYWQPLWNFCNADGDSEITSAELTTCAKTAAEYVGMSETTQGFLYNFGAKYWSLVDQDGSNGLNYDEYKYTMAAFAAVDARVILAGFDADDNGILEGDELSAWKGFVQGKMAEWNWNPSDSDVAALKAAWANAQMDGDANTGSMVEIAKFVVGAWNVMLN